MQNKHKCYKYNISTSLKYKYIYSCLVNTDYMSKNDCNEQCECYYNNAATRSCNNLMQDKHVSQHMFV